MTILTACAGGGNTSKSAASPEDKTELIIFAAASMNETLTQIAKEYLMGLGNSDVPVGQYAKEIFTSLGLWDRLNTTQKLTFASNVKEVTAQVSEGSAVLHISQHVKEAQVFLDFLQTDVCTDIFQSVGLSVPQS